MYKIAYLFNFFLEDLVGEVLFSEIKVESIGLFDLVDEAL